MTNESGPPDEGAEDRLALTHEQEAAPPEVSSASDGDPRWHLGQCIVWIATHDLAAAVAVADGNFVAHRGWLPAFDAERCWYRLVGRLSSGTVKATGIPAGEFSPREILTWEFHGLEIGYSGSGSAAPHLWSKRPFAARFEDVRILKDHVIDAFPAPENASAKRSGEAKDSITTPPQTNRFALTPGQEAEKAFRDRENARDDHQLHIDVARTVDGFFNQDRGRRRIRAVNWFIRRQERTALEDRLWLCLTEVADEFSRKPGAFAVDENECAAKLDALRRWILAGKFSIVLNVHPHVPPSEFGRFRFARDSAAVPELITPHLGDLWIKRRDCVAWANAHGFEMPHRLRHDAFSETRPPPKLARVDDGAMTATPQPQYPQRIPLCDYWISKGGVFPPRSQPSQPENFQAFEQWRKSSERQAEVETDQRAWREICAEAAAGKIHVEALQW